MLRIISTYVFILAFCFVVIFTLSLSAFMVSNVDSIVGSRITHPKSFYRMSPQERKVLFARAKVQAFIKAVKEDNFEVALRYWYAPKRGDLWHAFNKILKFTTPDSVSPETAVREKLRLIVDFLKGLNEYSFVGLKKSNSRGVAQILYLVADKQAAIDEGGDFTKVRYSASYRKSYHFDVCFYVYFRGHEPYIRKVTIEGPESHISELLRGSHPVARIQQ